jgi:hypothetical protein
MIILIVLGLLIVVGLVWGKQASGKRGLVAGVRQSGHQQLFRKP